MAIFLHSRKMFVSRFFFDALISFPFITWVVLVLEACECSLVDFCSCHLSFSGSVGWTLDLFFQSSWDLNPRYDKFLSNSVWSPSFAFLFLVRGFSLSFLSSHSFLVSFAWNYLWGWFPDQDNCTRVIVCSDFFDIFQLRHCRSQSVGPMVSLFPSLFLKGCSDPPFCYDQKVFFVDHLHAWLQDCPPQSCSWVGDFLLSHQSENSVHTAPLFQLLGFSSLILWLQVH